MNKSTPKGPVSKSNIQKFDNNDFYSDQSDKNANEDENFDDDYYGLGGVTESPYKKNNHKNVVSNPSPPMKLSSSKPSATNKPTKPVFTPLGTISLPKSYPLMPYP
jgi:hypothetical protein